MILHHVVLFTLVGVLSIIESGLGSPLPMDQNLYHGHLPDHPFGQGGLDPYSVLSTPSSYEIPLTPYRFNDQVGSTGHHADMTQMNNYWNSQPQGHFLDSSMAFSTEHYPANEFNQLEDMQGGHIAGSSMFVHHHHHQQNPPPLPYPAIRADRLSEYDWQLPLDDDTVLKVYKAVVPRWPPTSQLTMQYSIERLNAFLLNHQKLVQRILNHDEEAIETADSFSRPKVRDNWDSHAPLGTPDALYAWLQKPKLEKIRGLKWAPKELHPFQQHEMVEILHRAWIKDRNRVKQILAKLPEKNVLKWSKKVLNKDPKKAKASAVKWEKERKAIKDLKIKEKPDKRQSIPSKQSKKNSKEGKTVKSLAASPDTYHTSNNEEESRQHENYDGPYGQSSQAGQFEDGNFGPVTDQYSQQHYQDPPSHGYQQLNTPESLTYHPEQHQSNHQAQNLPEDWGGWTPDQMNLSR